MPLALRTTPSGSWMQILKSENRSAQAGPKLHCNLHQFIAACCNLPLRKISAPTIRARASSFPSFRKIAALPPGPRMKFKHLKRSTRLALAPGWRSHCCSTRRSGVPMLSAWAVSTSATALFPCGSKRPEPLLPRGGIAETLLGARATEGSGPPPRRGRMFAA